MEPLRSVLSNQNIRFVYQPSSNGFSITAIKYATWVFGEEKLAEKTYSPGEVMR